MWYCAHAVMAIYFTQADQNEFPAWENIFLVEAPTAQEAFAKAELRARQDEGDHGLTWDDNPAEFVFLGLRKLVKCYDGETRPSDGTELTYNRLLFDSREDLNSFAAGNEARATFEDEAPEEE